MTRPAEDDGLEALMDAAGDIRLVKTFCDVLIDACANFVAQLDAETLAVWVSLPTG